MSLRYDFHADLIVRIMTGVRYSSGVMRLICGKPSCSSRTLTKMFNHKNGRRIMLSTEERRTVVR